MLMVLMSNGTWSRPASSRVMTSAATSASSMFRLWPRANLTTARRSGAEPAFHLVNIELFRPAFSAASVAVMPLIAWKTKAYHAVTSYRAKPIHGPFALRRPGLFRSCALQGA